MKRDLAALVIVVLVSMLAPVSRAQDPSTRRAFEAANRDFAAAKSPEDFERVAGRFEALRADGAVCGAVLFDLGNAWFRAGRFGRAIAAYREAERFLPRDPTLLANLAEARRAANVEAPSPSLVDRLVFWRAWLSYPQTAKAALGLAVIAFLLALIQRLGVKAMRIPARIGVVLAACMFATYVVAYLREEKSQRAVVIEKEVIARKGDAESYAPAFTQPLREGQELTVLDARNGFVRIALENSAASSIDGWVPAAMIVVF